MLARLILAAVACLLATAALADPPPSSAPPYRPGVSLQPTAIYRPDGTVWDPASSGGGGSTTANQGTAGSSAWPMAIWQGGAPLSTGNPIFVQMTNPSPTGSVTGPGTAGSQAQAVQGVPNGVPQNVYPCQYNATLPTLSTGQTAYASCDLNGRMIVSFPASSQTIGSLFLVTSSAPGAGIVPQTTTGSSVVAKASAGNLYGYHATFGATAGFVAILNATAVPTAGAAIAPLECTPVAANASYRTRQDFGDRYTAGIVLLATASCTTFTAVTPLLMAALAN